MRAKSRQLGAGMVETMVGIVIGLLVVLVIYNIFSLADNYRRTAVGASDAQVTGMLSQLILHTDNLNGGNGLTEGASDLMKCQNLWNAGGLWTPAEYPLGVPLTPMPVVIKDGNGAANSDDIIVTYGASGHVAWPIPFMANAAPGASTAVVQTVTGFTVPPVSGAQPYWVVLIDEQNHAADATLPNGGSYCELHQAIAAAPAAVPPAPQSNMAVTLSTATTIPVGYGGYLGEPALPWSEMVILGPVGRVARNRYSVQLTATVDAAGHAVQTGVLRSLDLLTAGAVNNPIAQNVVLLKAQYGVDTDGDGIINCWTAANTPAITGNPCADGADYSFASLLNTQQGAVGTFWDPDSSTAVPKRMPTVAGAKIPSNRILAVRVGIVVQSEEPDYKDTTLTFGTRPQVVLFNCSANNGTCQGRVVVPNAIIRDSWRYRTYETVIPLVNAIYHYNDP